VYGIGYAVSRRGNPSNAQIINQFTALVDKIVQDVDSDWVLSGVNLGNDSHGRPIKAFATMMLAVAANLTAAQKTNLTNAIQSRAPYANVLWYGALTDEPTMQTRLRQFMGEQGADQVWLCVWDTPTATADQAALLAKFSPA
jgi:hypothetical protein